MKLHGFLIVAVFVSLSAGGFAQTLSFQVAGVSRNCALQNLFHLEEVRYT